MAENTLVHPVSDARPLGFRGLALLQPAILLALALPVAAQESWTAMSTTNAPTVRSGQTAVWTGSKMIVWGGFYGFDNFDTGGIHDPATDTWTATSTTDAPSGRYWHTAVWTGSKMIVWGGTNLDDILNTGGLYDPATDTWTATSTTNAPTGRYGHKAVWTGSRMIVWGGWDGTGYPSTGGIYDPTTDTWTATSTTNAPAGRDGLTAVWTGSRMIVWGGFNLSFDTRTGGIYDPATDTWTATSASTWAPFPRRYHSAVWTGSRMVIWGGYDVYTFDGHVLREYLNDGSIYDPATDTWTDTSWLNAPAPRAGHKAVWTGSRMIVWGGGFRDTSLSTGGIYDPTTGAWTATSTTNAPTGHAGSSAVWTDSKMIVWGAAGAVSTGGVYSNPAVLPPLPPAARFYTLTACRVVDTRNPAGPSGGPALVPGAVRGFPVTGGACGVPATATSVTGNVTVVEAAAAGHLTLFPGDTASPPVTSTINFSPGQTRANNATLLLATNGGTINVKNGSTGSVHLLLDVTGYFQ